MRAAVFIFLTAGCLAQTNTGTINGSVTDGHGAGVVGGTVVAVQDTTGIRSAVRTNETGSYSIPGLAIGRYSVTIEKPGFRRHTQTGVLLTAGETVELNATLEVGAVTDTVNVESGEPLVNGRTSELSQTIGARTIEDLPLANRRTINAIQMSGLVTFVRYDNLPTYSLAGGRVQSQMVWIDGGTGQNIRIGVGQQNVDPPIEAVEEIRILANTYSADYGGSAGGVIIETTKSGTNRLHGSAYEYLRNDALDAPGFFAPVVGGTKQAARLRYNLFGATAGGPIRRNKTFFYAAYEGTRRRTGSVAGTTLTVPTDLERLGNFSKSLSASGSVIPIYDPSVSPRQPFPGNLIPVSTLDPVALRVVGYFPRPNRAPDNVAGANNFRANSEDVANSDFLLVKADQSFNERSRLTGRYIVRPNASDPSSVYPDAAADPATRSKGRAHYLYGSWTRIISSDKVNEIGYTYVNRRSHVFSPSVGGNYPDKIGLTGVDQLSFPRFQFGGSYAPLGSTVQERWQGPIDQHQWIEDFSWLSGRHMLKAGGESRFSRNNDVNLQSVSGAFRFSPQSTGLPQTGTGGNALASLLLGLPLSFGEMATPALDRHSWYFAGYFKDDWSPTQDLTLNIGLRWEMDTPIIDANGRMSSFDSAIVNPVSNTPGVVKFAGVNGYAEHPYGFDTNNFGPRFGFAWKIMGSAKSVLRGGYGVFFAHPFDSSQTTAASLGASVFALLSSPDNGITAPFRLRDGVPPVTPASAPRDDGFGAVRVGQPASTIVDYFARDRVSGYAHQFNITIQRELPGSVIAEIAGLGNLGRKLPSANLNINQISPQILGPSHRSQVDRPFPQFSNVMLLAPSIGISNYYAGILKLEKHLSSGLTFVSSYTWSKFLGNTNDTANPDAGSLGQNNGPYSNYYDRRADYGPLESDVEHRLIISAIYEVPFGKGHRWLTHSLSGHLAGGWIIGALTSIQSGVPLTAVTSTDTTFAFPSGMQRADMVRDPNLPASRQSVTRWFDTGAFSQPALFRFGNEGVGIIRSGGWVNSDFSLLRNFGVGERSRLQFRAEAFNAFNHTTMAPPGAIYGTPTFGVVSFSGPGRQVQIGARLTF